ncbi:NUDIX domain-containing protein [Patescibacteria group bacterium]|nr:MAG: NUDIX domain-containing protein [Patescibacteria group bacterium]
MERHMARVIVAGFVEREGKLLVIRERPAELPLDHDPVINQPAGHVEKGEFLTDAVVREVLEETGFRVRPVELIGVHQATRPTRDHMAIYVLFRCELEDEIQGPIEATEIVETLWLTQEEVLARVSEHRSETTTARFRSYFSGTRYPLGVVTELNL